MLTPLSHNARWFDDDAATKVDFCYTRLRKGLPPSEEERNYSPYWKQQIEKFNGLFSLSDRQVLPVDHMLLHTVNLSKQTLQLSGIPPDCGAGTTEPLATMLGTQDQLTNCGQAEEESCDLHHLLSVICFSIEHQIGVSGLDNRNAAQLIHAIHDLFKSFDDHQT